MNPEIRQAIKEAYLAHTLCVEAVDPMTGIIGKYPVAAVLQHYTPHKRMIQVELVSGARTVVTEDHSLFQLSLSGQIESVPTSVLREGGAVVVIEADRVVTSSVKSLEDAPQETYTYDLSIPGPENFKLSNGVLAHNSYSIGGVSLDIEKASLYESLKQNAESQFDKATEAKARTVKFVRGLQQQRFGIGVRSSFGPQLARGVLSPRNFL